MRQTQVAYEIYMSFAPQSERDFIIIRNKRMLSSYYFQGENLNTVIDDVLTTYVRHKPHVMFPRSLDCISKRKNTPFPPLSTNLLVRALQSLQLFGHFVFTHPLHDDGSGRVLTGVVQIVEADRLHVRVTD